jgi:hypothetical protein
MLGNAHSIKCKLLNLLPSIRSRVEIIKVSLVVEKTIPADQLTIAYPGRNK